MVAVGGRRRPRLAALAVVVLLAAAAGCGRDAAVTGEDGEGREVGGARRLSPVPGFDLTTIKLGALTPLTGPVAGAIGIPLTEGNRVYLEKVNADGGIAGKYKLELIAEDNAYNTDNTKAKYKQIKDSVVMFAQILGTPPTSAVLVDLKTDRMMASPASLDAEWIGEENLLPVGAPYQAQVINGLAYALGDGGAAGKRVCAFAAEDAYGEAGLEGLQFAAKEMGFAVAAIARYTTTDTDFTAQVTQLENAKCGVVVMTSLPTPTNAFLGKAQQLGLDPQYFVAQSPSWLPTYAANPLWQKNVLYVAEGTTWGDETVPGMKEMIADVKRFRPDQKPDTYFTFGYAQMKAVVELLEEAVSAGDLSREGILRASQNLGTVEFGGLFGDYGYGKAGDRKPPKANTVFKVNPGVPGGLEALKKNFASAPAQMYEFKK
ncbi:MAG: ABC transporter substrate-binding protein [Actinobacteria bacterium]|nr:ABC transporter substrate-binding protein [Actinomycetota bacterium]